MVQWKPHLYRQDLRNLVVVKDANFPNVDTGHGMDDFNPWEEVLAVAPTEVPCCGTKFALLLATPNT
ncbi:hypothetical protein E2562_018215 [Oryza meyeriana var. granulata]|uniref:Uncharacterized protein n=1 Tax=Oryza meyeriana var. granulata TaxID=110450 RepID=A0A6G1CH05_9ORYZ|nr:hypothetical protein E2562_018215 [Oryza meyeriana var. granulata]